MKKSGKLKNYPDRFEQLNEIKDKAIKFRYFKEYDTVMNNEVMITIEYW